MGFDRLKQDGNVEYLIAPMRIKLGAQPRHAVGAYLGCGIFGAGSYAAIPLDELRGWLLLARAQLSAGERDSVVSSLRHDFSCDAIAQRLQLTWPDEGSQAHDRRQSGKEVPHGYVCWEDKHGDHDFGEYQEEPGDGCVYSGEYEEDADGEELGGSAALIRGSPGAQAED